MLGLVVGLVGCAKKEAKSEPQIKEVVKEVVVEKVVEVEKKADPSKYYKIDLVSKGYQHEFWRTVEAGAQQAAMEFGVNVNFIGPEKETEIAKQLAMVENSINKRVDALAIAALDKDALKPVIKKVIKAGIPVVSFDSDVAGDITESFIATDNMAAGAIAANYMGKLVNGQGKVAVVAHSAGSTTGIERRDGFINEIKAKFPNIQLLNPVYTDGDKNKSLAATLDLLNANPDLAGIYATNEGCAFGVAKAVEERGLTGDKLAVVGFDASEDLVRFIEKDVVDGTVIQDPFMMGYLSVESLVKLLNGEKIEKRIDTGAVLVTTKNITDEKILKKIFPFGR
ncbi:LacI family transcriptional regulator [candidate division KSB3 bacterium]|uniref:LacI family transcriptional regulator n=1 Tax=candidate division KSB3 bacterium TaxID=2044937 RepID=A0A2G6ECQ2_9BACT|nr:MAG: LacI family transcriptional regulator [candidate division KSB3 bacterium]